MRLEEKEKFSNQITFIADAIILITVLFFWTTTLDAFNFPKQFVISTGIGSLILVAVLRDRFLVVLNDYSRLDSLLVISLVLVLLLAVPHGLTSVTNFWGSFSRANGTLTKVILIMVVLIYARYSSEKSINRFFGLAIFLLLTQIVYGVMQLNGLDPIPWVNPYNNIFVTAGNPNFAAALLAILVILSSRFLILGSSLSIRIFALVMIALGTYMSYATKSIQGILTIAIGFFMVGFIWSLKHFGKKRNKLIATSGLTILGIPVALGVFNLGPLAPWLFQETLSIRLHYWRVALRIIRDHALFGVGNDAYGDYYRLYREDWFVDKYGPGLISTNAHNVALQWGTDIGVIGLAVYALFLVIAVYAYIKHAQSFTGQQKLNDLDFLFTGFLAFYIQSLISISQLSVTCIGFALLGILCSIYRRDKKQQEHRNKRVKSNSPSSFVGAGTWWIVFCLALAPFTSTFIRKDVELRRAILLPGASQDGADLQFRSERIMKAAQFFLEDQDYSSSAINNLFNQGIAQNGLILAKEVEKVNPNSFASYSAQVLAYSNSGQNEELMVAAQKALRLDPLNYSVRYQLGKSLVGLARFADAEREIKLVLQQAPKGSSDYLAAQSLLAEMKPRLEP